MTTPEVICCPDRHFCRVVYGLGPYITDYPEQTLASEVVQGWCSKCIKHHMDLGDPTGDLCRCREHTDELITYLDPRILWTDYGIITDVIVST